MEKKRTQAKATDFRVIHLLGKGDVGHVYLVEHREMGGFYAMKVIQKEEILRRKKLHRLTTEWEVLCGHDHPFMARLYWCFQSCTKLYFVMEYCPGGEFFRFLQKQKGSKLTEDAARFYAAEVLLALEYLHLNGFVYRDMKPENILMNCEGHLMLTDFDLSKKTTSEPKIVVSKATAKMKGSQVATTPPSDENFSSFVGTAEYIAPEVIKDVGHNFAVDWWGFGILIYEMLYGTTPFKGTTQDDTFKKITQASGPLHFPSRPVVSDSCKALIKGLLNPTAKLRLGSTSDAAEIKAHKWFKSVNFTLIRNQNPPLIPIVADPEILKKKSKMVNNDGVLSDSDPDNFIKARAVQEALKRNSKNTHNPSKRITPYNHPGHDVVDPFRALVYYEHHDIGNRKYALPTTPTAPTLGCTGFGRDSVEGKGRGYDRPVRLPAAMMQENVDRSPPIPTLTHRITEKLRFAFFRSGSGENLKEDSGGLEAVQTL
eukprot:TRINITY_DN10739_c0_g1_i1.p1 TRINITY_DN10739_c0_g1~~TRINITY_DN10739_c0_g1_i1.p1  ORF type:complete len:485 (+),score=62.45 TRINITY_DN10739_c0_g1_i1:110-1564(+)